jgi:hypothetical protein
MNLGVCPVATPHILTLANSMLLVGWQLQRPLRF